MRLGNRPNAEVPHDVNCVFRLREASQDTSRYLFNPLTHGRHVKRLSILTPNRRAKLTPLSGTAEVVPVVNRGDPRGFV